jgi:hypothetical protein
MIYYILLSESDRIPEFRLCMFRINLSYSRSCETANVGVNPTGARARASEGSRRAPAVNAEVRVERLVGGAHFRFRLIWLYDIDFRHRRFIRSTFRRFLDGFSAGSPPNFRHRRLCYWFKLNINGFKWIYCIFILIYTLYIFYKDIT